MSDASLSQGASGFRVALVLADYVAQEKATGKVTLVGGFTNAVFLGVPMGIAVRIEVPWEWTNTRHRLALGLLTEDLRQVAIQTPQGEHPFGLALELEAGRAPGVRKGARVPAVLCFNVPPLPLTPGNYVWKLSINEESHPDWELAFTVMAPPQAAQAPPPPQRPPASP